MSTIIYPSYCRQPLQTLRRLRNGRYPEASVATWFNEEANRIVGLRVKGWSFASAVRSIPATGGSRTRWVFAFRSSTHASYLWARFLVAPSNVTTNPYTRLACVVTGSGTEDPYADAHAANETESDSPSEFQVLNVPTNDGTTVTYLTPDTNYEAYITDYNGARTVACCIWEVAMSPDTDNGYLESGYVAGQPIFDSHRASLVSVLREAWLSNGAPLITYSHDLQADMMTNATATDTNVIDGTSGSPVVTTATAGFTIDCRYRSTVRRAASGVPCIMKVYGFVGGDAVGSVKLIDANNSTIVTVTLTNPASSDNWYTSSAFYLPATVAKYDITCAKASGTGTISFWAASIYQLE